MTHIAKGRADMLVTKIVKCLDRARFHFGETEINYVFGDLLKDHVIKEKLEELKKREHTDKH